MFYLSGGFYAFTTIFYIVFADGRQQKWSNNRVDVDDDDKKKDNVPMNCRETNHASAINGKEMDAVSKI